MAAAMTSNGREGEERRERNGYRGNASPPEERDMRSVAGRGITQPNTRFLDYPRVLRLVRLPRVRLSIRSLECLSRLSFLPLECEYFAEISLVSIPWSDHGGIYVPESLLQKGRRQHSMACWRSRSPLRCRHLCAFLASWRQMQVGKIRAFPP